MNRMSRRLFLGGGAGLVLAGAGLARRPAAALASTEGKNPLGPFYISLMERCEFEWAADDLIVLADRLPEEGFRAQKVVYRLLKDGGYETLISSIYVRQDVTLYLLGHQNGYDGTSPVFTGHCFGTMFEGMTVIALALAAEDWTFPKGIAVADGLVPRNTLHHSSSWLDKSMVTPYHALTGAGDVAIRYESDPDKRLGEIEVLSREVDGEPIFNALYQISW
jgi:hypothetical protein